ncbi:hypothetical protein Pmani_024526 [Petrolisthes manimaculis]|uniref:Uncharacterized protein n=1 Tax=Petrolisthes manimaculis TaxID=1843537 RepID=A0AAE1TZ97_9EUCA|nr:hypothetical protein Pmani_024526 [Petrolisthes manimaculis]
METDKAVGVVVSAGEGGKVLNGEGRQLARLAVSSSSPPPRPRDGRLSCPHHGSAKTSRLHQVSDPACDRVGLFALPTDPLLTAVDKTPQRKQHISYLDT